ncbi:GAF domain-containing protein [Aurantibacter crassamenti]|uniref:GAF domain-containing protein n=1 Tax=Aurantibacter crassamenti TaxID=1837375 RepID=UPI00193AB178|nr:GAF domain-containing protein [Aurantibacter crassamenti]MBM1104764.1 GAF domain-containing protein [Aurantibacter crassamenti]
MGFHNNKELPLNHFISFNKLLEHYEGMANGEDEFLAERARYILKTQEAYPELREGFTDVSILKTHEKIIRYMLQDTFPEVLTNNEIKAASLPYQDVVFNSTKRFQQIIKDAGIDFVPRMRELPDDEMYVLACAVILNFYYGVSVDFKRPFFYDIPDLNGIMKHYRILYNADFIEIIPTDKAKKLSKNDIEELLDNYDNVALWKEKIPPNSFNSKGFVVMNMFDVTTEHSISEIKSNLISIDNSNDAGLMEKLTETFRSFFNLKSVNTGFVLYNSKENQFECVYGKGSKSVLLQNKNVVSCNSILCQESYRTLLIENNYFAISDVDKMYKMSDGMAPYKNLKEEGYKSAIFAPIASEGVLLGVLEITSTIKGELNSINAQRLDQIMPFIISAVLRANAEEENLIDAIIQNECTSVHSSVYWKFQEEAKNFIKETAEGLQPSFKEIVFKDVSPLYGQIDIRDSSKSRNNAIQRDLMIQLSAINQILTEAWQKTKLPFYEELIFRVNNHIDEIKESLHTNSEQAIFNFVTDEITPVFEHLKTQDVVVKKLVEDYEQIIDAETNSYYDHRKNYDTSVMLINKKLASVIDKKQVQAQEMYPHYFERYKTDGVEHNMYIGDSITGERSYEPLYLNNLRLWQLQVMCEMENTHYSLKPELPVPLDVASLILVYNTSLSIRFRMDEKQFDVDGTYNARYEIIKKRIDKSFVKGTNERLTQTGKMVIVYSQKSDELEYLRYIKFLKSKGYFTGNIEIVELQGLQGVAGLKAIRAEILYKKDKKSEKTYTYADLMEELKA